MKASKATEQRQDSKLQHSDLDSRYGEIGISAVVAALRHQGELHNTAVSNYTPYERD